MKWLKKVLLSITALSLITITAPMSFAEDNIKVYDMTDKEPVLEIEVPDGDYKINILTGGDTQTDANIYINGGERVRAYTLAAGEEQDNEQYAIPKNGKITIEVKGETPNLKTITLEEIPPRQKGEYPTIYIAGDSTAQTYNYETAYPQTGWGQVFDDFFTDEIKIENRAMGGRSSKSFDNDGRLDKILAQIRPGDYLLIQFGINDGAVNKPERYISVDDYKTLITEKYITETLNRGATPILLTATAASWWDEENQCFMESRQDYAVPTLEIAEKTGTMIFDVNKTATDIWNTNNSPQNVLSGFFICEPLESTAYPEGTDDHTHLKEKGARFQASLIAEFLKSNVAELSEFIVLNPAELFDDIEGHWAQNVIVARASSLNLNGRTKTTFEPDSQLTRAEFLKMAMDASGLNGHSYRAGECADADADDWYRFYLQGALDKGLIPAEMIENCSGTEPISRPVSEESQAMADIVSYTGSELSFNADKFITREEMAAILYNCLTVSLGGEPSLPDGIQGITKQFSDISEISTWAVNAVEKLSSLNILYGYEDNTFKPAQTLTRAEAVKAVAEAAELIEYPN